MQNKIKTLMVSSPQGIAGALHKESRFSFNYDTGDRDREISLTMPLRHESYSSTTLAPIFEMNRPEGYLLDRIRQRFAKAGGLDDMSLLKLTGGNQIGRLRYSDPDTEPAQRKVSVSMKEILDSSASQALFEFLADTYFDSGISGFQPKIMLPTLDQVVDEKITATTSDFIVKASGEDFLDLAQNEYLCMDAARRAGIRIPEFWLSNDGGLFVMRRFDVSKDGEQMGFEDAAVLMNKHASEKYVGSYENVAKMIDIYCGENAMESKARLFEYIALTVMTRNGDGHLKNFGLTYDHPNGLSPELAPLYDVVTTSIYTHVNQRTGETKADRTLALKLNKTTSYPYRENLLNFGKTTCLVSNPAAVIDRIQTGMRESLAENKPRISSWLYQQMKAEWEEGMTSVLPLQVFVAQ